jgi:hypothetical protein
MCEANYHLNLLYAKNDLNSTFLKKKLTFSALRGHSLASVHSADPRAPLGGSSAG